MIKSIKNWLRPNKNNTDASLVSMLPNVAELVEQGSDILDVRSVMEFQTGAVEQSHNIPVIELKKQRDKIDRLNQPIVVCCASGMRSSMAVAHLRGKGIEAVDAGSWKKLDKLIKARKKAS